MTTWQIVLAFGGTSVALWMMNRVMKTLEEMNKRTKRIMVVIEEMNNRENIRELDAKYRERNASKSPD
jgi:aspartokinase